jgi:ribosome maturation factor RimP
MTLEEKLGATLNGLGYELVDMSQSLKSGLLRIFIDKPEGITLDDCERVSNHLGDWLAVENVTYERLEISSPGLDRPLKRLADFQRFLGRDVQLRLRMALSGQRRFLGKLVSADVTGVVVQIDGHDVTFGLDNIDQARLVPDV